MGLAYRKIPGYHIIFNRTLENIDEAVQQRGAFRAKIEFYGILEEYNGNRYAFFKDLGRETEDNYFVELT